MTGKNRVKWKIIETDAAPLLVREETALQLSTGSLDFITHLSSDSHTFPVLFQNRNELPDFIHIRRIELDMFRTIDRDEIKMAVHLSGQTAELLGIFRRGIDILNKDVFKGHSPPRGFEIITGCLNYILDFEIAAHRKNPVSDFIVRGMEGNSQGKRQVLLGQSVNLGHNAAGGKGDISKADIQQTRIIGQSDETENFLIVGERFAGTHEDDGMDRCIQFFFESIHLGQHF